MSARTRYGIFHSVRLLCSGDVHLVLCGRWVILTELGHLITICWPAGECFTSAIDLRLILILFSPTLVANIWDVTDRDIDKFSQSVFDRLRLTMAGLRQQSRSQTADEGVSLVAAVAQSRNSCKLKYLTGAAPVVYGIPFYL
jgi:hypothetical protein